MSSSGQFLGPAEAARTLGVSVKALRLYEKRGLIEPLRSMSGWRAYGPEQMERAAAIAALRAIGLGLAEIRTMLDGDDAMRSSALATHEIALEAQLRELVRRIATVRGRRADLGPSDNPKSAPPIAFDLPWPWAGERFELKDVRPLTFITGPLFSGKTRLAQAIAESLPGGVFVGLDRSADGRARRDSRLKQRTEHTIKHLIAAGATANAALGALVLALEANGARPLVIDMVEQGLDGESQAAVIAWLRQRAREAAGPLFVMTRSKAILDLDAARADEAIILCPANHNPPIHVAPFPAAPGFEAAASCLGTPEARARTEGVIAIHAKVA